MGNRVRMLVSGSGGRGAAGEPHPGTLRSRPTTCLMLASMLGAIKNGRPPEGSLESLGTHRRRNQRRRQQQRLLLLGVGRLSSSKCLDGWINGQTLGATCCSACCRHCSPAINWNAAASGREQDYDATIQTCGGTVTRMAPFERAASGRLAGRPTEGAEKLLPPAAARGRRRRRKVMGH